MKTPRPEVSDLADRFIALMRSFGKARARMMAAAASDLEWTSQIILKTLASEGPMRATSLADCVQLDPSTVSRQVAGLVRDGLLDRHADPDDGRASVLALTARANEVLADHDRIRLEYFDRVFEQWTDAELRQFADQLGRFVHDYETHNAEWISERIAARSARARSNN